MKLTRTNLQQGQYEGLLTTAKPRKTAPSIDLILHENVIAKCALESLNDGTWRVQATLPNDFLTDVRTTFLFIETGTLNVLDSLTIEVNDSEQASLREEVALLSEQLDMLKRAFRNKSRIE